MTADLDQIGPLAMAASGERPGPRAAALLRARFLLEQAQAAVAEATALDRDDAKLSPNLCECEDERGALRKRLDEVEHQVGALMTLFVAAYQMHASLDPLEVQSTIGEVAVNIIGARHFVLLLRDEDEEEFAVCSVQGDVEPAWAASARYAGGDPLIDCALADGQPRFGPVPGSSVLAAVPLRVQDVTMGVLAVLELVPHRAGFEKDERELIELLGAHAASALFAAREYTKTARKLRTLEGLMALVKQG